jgi:hypothetical protein
MGADATATRTPLEEMLDFLEERELAKVESAGGYPRGVYTTIPGWVVVGGAGDDGKPDVDCYPIGQLILWRACMQEEWERDRAAPDTDGDWDFLEALGETEVRAAALYEAAWGGA